MEVFGNSWAHRSSPKTKRIPPITNPHPGKSTPKRVGGLPDPEGCGGFGQPRSVCLFPPMLRRCQNTHVCPRRGGCAAESAPHPKHSLALEEAESEGEMSEEPSHCSRLMMAWLSATSKLSFSTLPSASGRDLAQAFQGGTDITGVPRDRWDGAHGAAPSDAGGLPEAQPQSQPSKPPRKHPCSHCPSLRTWVSHAAPPVSVRAGWQSFIPIPTPGQRPWDILDPICAHLRRGTKEVNPD